LSKKNKTKLRKAKKTKRTRRFRKQYGGDLIKPQIKYIKEQIKDLGFTAAEKKKVIWYFNVISSHVSKTLPLENKSSTVIVEFFKNFNSKYEQDSNLTDEAKRVKREQLKAELFDMYYRFMKMSPMKKITVNQL
jgi:hypothetical protein